MNITKNVESCGDCWLWTGVVTTAPVVYENGRYVSARRKAFEQRYGSPRGRLTATSTCPHPDRCVNPEHATYVSKNRRIAFESMRDSIPAPPPPPPTLHETIAELTAEGVGILELLTQVPQQDVVSLARAILEEKACVRTGDPAQ